MPAKILIVDDEPDLELLVRQRFRRQELAYEFVFARNGAEALQAVAGDPQIEVVLSDIKMPVMDGLTLLARLREVRPILGKVILSAYGDMTNIRAAMNLGAHDFLTKPIDFEDFELTVAKTLRQVREQRQAALDRERLVAVERDLETAAEIQRAFLARPEHDQASRDDFMVHARMLPAREVGGDFFDWFLLDDRRLGLVVGDVAGKGVPAALLMAVTKTLVRGHAFRSREPAECLAAVNEQLLRDCPAGRFVTLFYGVLHTDTGELQCSTGGHHPPYVLRVGGTVEAINGRGLLVGALKEAVYHTRRVQLGPGDGLFLYTDGVVEARNERGEHFSRPALEAALVGPVEPHDVVGRVVGAVERFVRGSQPSDDLTALALHYRGTPQPP